jgi:hypothetical protein
LPLPSNSCKGKPQQHGHPRSYSCTVSILLSQEIPYSAVELDYVNYRLLSTADIIPDSSGYTQAPGCLICCRGGHYYYSLCSQCGRSKTESSLAVNKPLKEKPREAYKLAATEDHFIREIVPVLHGQMTYD